MKINKKILMCIACLLTIVSVFLVLCYIFIWKIPSASEIFKKYQTSIVELKSQTGEELVSYGTAVFIDDDGTLVSNAHLVVYKESGKYKEFENFEIRFSYENEYRNVTLIKYDLNEDISILKLDNLTNVNFKTAKIGNSEKISSGDKVYAVGNGMNHGIGITQGLVSLPQVNIKYDGIIRKVIQCDLIINEGNSGGALLNERGKLIGITTFRLKDNSGNIIYGIAFCIPISCVLNYYNNF